MPRNAQRPSQRVEEDLRRRLAAGEWAAGDALPTTAQLAEEYGCGHGTITRVLRKLADERLVHSVPRWGVFAGPPDSQD
ncbi:MAG TPA: winged helix-turn-helix domain-containing protein [Streptosporangiaceae bacterium]|nr:winged helix-turn-helix domain-containing protein [Streptosporangiaceae bacterium]